MGMDDAIDILAPAVDGAVDDEARLMHGRVRVLDEIAVEIDLDQVRRRHLVEQEPKTVEQEMPGLARHPRRDVGIDQVGPAEMLDQPVAGGEIDALLPLRWFDLRSGGRADGGHALGHFHSPCSYSACSAAISPAAPLPARG